MKGLTGKSGTRQTAGVLGWVSDFYEAETALPNESCVCYQWWKINLRTRSRFSSAVPHLHLLTVAPHRQGAFGSSQQNTTAPDRSRVLWTTGMWHRTTLKGWNVQPRRENCTKFFIKHQDDTRFSILMKKIRKIPPSFLRLSTLWVSMYLHTYKHAS